MSRNEAGEAAKTTEQAVAGAQGYLTQETRFQGRYASTLLNTLYQAYQPFFLRTLFFLVLGLMGRIALLGNTNLIGLWVDSFCRAPAVCRPAPAWVAGFDSQHFMWALIGATAVGFLFTAIYRVGLSRYSVQAVSSIYDETTFRTSRFTMGFFDRNPAGRIITRFSSDYNNIFRVFGGPLAEFIALIFDLIAMTVLIGAASLWFLPFWVAIAGLNYLVYRFHLPALRRERRELARSRSPGIAHFAETVQGAPTVRAFGKEGEFTRRFSFLNDTYLIQRLRTVGVFSRFSLSMSTVTALVFLATGVAGIWLVQSGRATVGSIGVVFTYIGLSNMILQAFFEWLGQFEEAMTGLERMDEYLRKPLEPGAHLPGAARFATGHPTAAPVDSARVPTGAAAASGAPDASGAEVRIENLWMRYRDDGPAVLKGLDFVVRPGERLGVVGRTGSGKTSLVQALFRLYPIERGEIRVGGAGPEDLGLIEYRRRMAFITQEPTLFLGQLRDNLQPRTVAVADDGTLAQALERVQFLPLGSTRADYLRALDWPVEERGRNLSAGERQLICMARCLLQAAPVVIMDEATSAVDPRSEEILVQATEQFFAGKTRIIIAHRLSTVQQCDRILWLDNGEVRRLGPPGEVLPELERLEHAESQAGAAARAGGPVSATRSTAGEANAPAG